MNYIVCYNVDEDIQIIDALTQFQALEKTASLLDRGYTPVSVFSYSAEEE